MKQKILFSKLLAVAIIVVFIVGLCQSLYSATIDITSDQIILKNQFLFKKLIKKDNAFLTTELGRADKSDLIQVRSDEFHILLLNNKEFTVKDYKISGNPEKKRINNTEIVEINYIPDSTLPAEAPQKIIITYLIKDEPYIRKTIRLIMKKGQAVDRLQVERFSTTLKASRGGRGEPVFIADTWFGGLEYPASLIQHSDDFKFPVYSIPNPSKISYQGRDKETQPRKGLITMAHFPGLVKKQDPGTKTWYIQSKTAVMGVGKKGDTMELVFHDYMKTIRLREPRNYLHHNNWYDFTGKNLSIDNYAGKIAKNFYDNFKKYGVQFDGMVPDNGWQNKESIWEPKDDVDLEGIARELNKYKMSFGIWIAANGYNTRIDWGVKKGYKQAVPNEWFKKFKPYYCIVDPKYNKQMFKAFEYIIKKGNLKYIKHDFNEMCCIEEGHGHLPTERHGHESSVDVMIDLLKFEIKIQPDIIPNITNWIWFSPWWRMHSEILWMMGKDAGTSTGWPQLAVRQMGMTFRDSHFHTNWTDYKTRPLNPISCLMTHGIIFGDKKHRGDKKETMHDWSDYVMLYYARGVMLKELYITADMMTPERWEALGKNTRWAVDNAKNFLNSVAIGGNADNGEIHGYISWTDDHAILSLRNPGRKEQSIRVPFDQTVWYRGELNKPFKAKTVYPYYENVHGQITSGKSFSMTVPGDMTVIYELDPGTASKIKPAVESLSPLPGIKVEKGNDSYSFSVKVPDENMKKCDILFQYYGLPAVASVIKINNQVIIPHRETSSSRKNWIVSQFDIRKYAGQTITVEVLPGKTASKKSKTRRTFDIWFTADRPVKSVRPLANLSLPFLIMQNYRRQSELLLEKAEISSIHDPEAIDQRKKSKNTPVKTIPLKEIKDHPILGVWEYENKGKKYIREFNKNGICTLKDIKSNTVLWKNEFMVIDDKNVIVLHKGKKELKHVLIDNNHLSIENRYTAKRK